MALSHILYYYFFRNNLYCIFFNFSLFFFALFHFTRILNNHIPLTLSLCPKLLPRKERLGTLSFSLSVCELLSLFNGGGRACKINPGHSSCIANETNQPCFSFCLVFYNVMSWLKIWMWVTVLLGFMLSLLENVLTDNGINRKIESWLFFLWRTVWMK